LLNHYLIKIKLRYFIHWGWISISRMKTKIENLTFYYLSDWKKCQKFAQRLVNFWCSECQTEFRSFFLIKREKKENKFSFQDIFYDFCKTEKLIQNLFFFFGFSNGNTIYCVYSLKLKKQQSSFWERVVPFGRKHNFPTLFKIFKNGKLTEKTIVFTWSK
jgi:thiol-disulfide isomerase/thioredoxin